MNVEAVPAETAGMRQELGAGRRHSLYEWRATVLTAVHSSWLRRDWWWAALPVALVAILCPH